MTNNQNNVFCQLEAFNNWLHDVYDENTSFRSLIMESGFSQIEAEQILKEHLSLFLQAVINLISELTNTREERGIKLIVRIYGLLDCKAQSIFTVGASVGVSPTRIRQLVDMQLSLYRDPDWRIKFQNQLILIVQRLLNFDKDTKEAK